MIWAVHRRRLQTQVAERTGLFENLLLLGPHRSDHSVETIELNVEHRARQLGRPGAVARKGFHRVVATEPVEMARIDGTTRALGEQVVVDRDAAAFPTGHILIVVEAECAHMADGAKFSALIAAADALAGVLDDDEIVSPRHLHDGVHVASRAPHMDRHDRPSARTDRGFDRLLIDGDTTLAKKWVQRKSRFLTVSWGRFVIGAACSSRARFPQRSRATLSRP